MAVQEALAEILQDWPDIEPLLTVSELRRLADIGDMVVMRGSSPRAEYLLGILRPVRRSRCCARPCR